MTLAEKIAFARHEVSKIIAVIKQTENPHVLDELTADLCYWWQEMNRLEELDGVVYGV